MGVQVEMSLVHAAENETKDVKHELEEPKGLTFCIDNFLSMDIDNDVKFYGINDFHYRAERGQRSKKDGLHTYIAQQGEDELNLGALDGILDEIDEVEGDAAAESLAAACKDYLSDLDFTQEISALNNHPRNEIRIGNSSSESHSTGCSGSSDGDGAVAMSESLAGTDPEYNGHDGTCKATTSCGMNTDCRNQSGHAQCGEFNNRLDSSNHGNPKDLWNMTNASITLLSYGRNNSVEAIPDDVDIRQKRRRKPTRRLIEESVDSKSSRRIHAAEKFVIGASEGHRPRGRPPGRMSNVASGMLVSLPVEESWEEDGLKALTHTYARRVRSQEPEIFVEDEVESFLVESEDEIVKKKSKKGGDRRKHQRMWTLLEVTKLVDGISEFGVGRWTQIKRLSFAASAHRTPIDLRDKWRNLLRASYAQKPNKGVTEEKEKNAGRPLPKSLLCHVRELRSLHPYPRKNASRSPSLPVGKNGVDGRNIHRRNNI